MSFVSCVGFSVYFSDTVQSLLLSIGYVCICASVYEREREREELLKYFGEAGHTFYETLKGTLE